MSDEAPIFDDTGDQGAGIRPADPRRIIAEVCDFYHVTECEIRGNRRYANWNLARQVAMYLLRQHTRASFEFIGVLLGNRDHSTIMHGVSAMAERILGDRRVASQVLLIESLLRTNAG